MLFAALPAQRVAAQSSTPVAKLPHTAPKQTTGFIPNVGQLDGATKFQTQREGGRLNFTVQGIGIDVFTAPPKSADSVALPIGKPKPGQIKAPPPPLHIDMLFDNVKSGVAPQGETVGKAVISYFHGNDPSKWHPRVPIYDGIQYTQIYPGIDLHYDASADQVKGTYIVAAHSDPSVISWHYQGHNGLEIDPKTGGLIITMPNGKATITEQAAVAWQIINGKQTPVDVHYRIDSGASIHFVLGTYDANVPLTIDPTILFSGYNTNDDASNAVAVDRFGNTYVASYVEPAIGSAGMEATVSKYDNTGTLVETTQLGGDHTDNATGIVVDASGTMYITGYTDSVNFTVRLAIPVQHSYQTQLSGNAYGYGNTDAFVVVLNPDMSAIPFSTYFGGTASRDVTYQNLYPGIDFRPDGTTLSGVYLVAPGADPSRIRWHYEGQVQPVFGQRNSVLDYTLPYNLQMSEQRLIGWQPGENGGQVVAACYTHTTNGSYGIELGRYDSTKPLVIGTENFYSGIECPLSAMWK